MHDPNISKEIDSLIKIGIFKNYNFQRAAPNFIIPKINGTVIVFSKFREQKNSNQPFSIC